MYLVGNDYTSKVLHRENYVKIMLYLSSQICWIKSLGYLLRCYGLMFYKCDLTDHKKENSNKYRYAYQIFLAHLSWKLKWVSSVVCQSVCPSINFSNFRLLLKNHWANFNQTWHKASLCEGDSFFFKWRPCPLPSGDNYEIAKIHWRNLKIFFSRTTEPISTKVGIKHSWVKGIQVCSNEGQALFQVEIITK